jgi:predicted aldo/keto reductase-like oxidoreductase
MKHEKNDVSRRQFLAGAAALSSAPIIASCTGGSKMPLSSNVQTQSPNDPSLKSSAATMPTRPYGKTGLSVSILGFGCGSKFSALSNPAGRYAALDAALAGGINYFDCASEYGTASTLGNYWAQTTVPVARDKVIIVDKINARDYAAAKTEFNNQLTQLKTSYVDVLLCHALPASLDLAALGSATGAWQFCKEAKALGTARFIGFSSMDDGAGTGVLKDFCNTLEPDVCTLAMNVTGYGNLKGTTLPAANAKGMGVAAIKTLLGVVGAARPVATCLGYLWALKDAGGNDAISTLIVGHDGGATQVDTNVGVAKAWGTGVLNEAYNWNEVERNAKPLAGPHALAWARPDFKDNGKEYIWS